MESKRMWVPSIEDEILEKSATNRLTNYIVELLEQQKKREEHKDERKN